MSEEAIYAPPSPDWDYVTLKWAGTNLDGSVVVGTIVVEYDGVGPFLDDSETLPISVFKKSIVANITSRTFVVGETSFTVGYAEVKVPVSNDPDIAGSGATYTFSENFSGGRKSVSFVADGAVPGGVIWLNKIAPVTPDPGVPASVVYYSDFIELTDRVTFLEENGTGGGGTGTDGREVQLQVNATHIQWRYEGQSTWTDLIALSALEGPQGDAGNSGDDGESPELRVDSGYIQWRLPSAGSWTNLVELATLEGPQGEAGADGDDGAPGDLTQVADGAIPQAKLGNEGWISTAIAERVTGFNGAVGLWIGTQSEFDLLTEEAGVLYAIVES